ncbi:ferrous iron transport protein B [Marinicella sp. S1101]|uniref:ferrous iron transport protein B n=1 Tax=Marinicella marina TaxID=2996016 RepID=UPI0022609E18|nr:ferrous iron transport protein B [Marinicella marina]MCX7552570.1 ferrous iron transport protein B [Marinicella marina]MDJ1139446.1 ferrous iron transport protein B [Marinicella marina]
MINHTRVALIGNPNSGKTTLFNALAGQNKKTGNWAGVTVSESKAKLLHKHTEFMLVDLPGIYGLSLTDLSQDELVAKQAIKNNDIDVFVNVLNANNLERGLFLTTEVLELNVPTILVLNMDDERAASGKALDVEKLKSLTGCAVISTTAIHQQGLTELIDAIVAALADSSAAERQHTDLSHANPSDEANKQAIKSTDGVSSENKAIFDARFKLAMDMANAVTTHTPMPTVDRNKTSFSRVDRWLTSPLTGSLSFLFVMYLMFFFATNVASVFVDFFDIATGALFIDGTSQLLATIQAPAWLTVVMADGIGAGIQTVATFIPVIGFLFLFLTLLEESGYMVRAAFVMNNWLQKIGLSGKAFVPLIVSFGCNVPAVMATRQLAKKDERIITTMMAPFMSCGARLSVYALFVAAFFTENAALIVLSLYLTGILVAVATGLLLRKTILPGKPDPFLIELPQWRFPGLRYILKSTWYKLRGFMIDAGKIIIIIVLILQIISSVGRDFTWGNTDVDESLLAAGSQLAAPVFAPMGIEQENWPAVVGLFTGLLAKEVMVGSLDAIYSKSLVEDDATMGEQLIAALQSIPDNAAGLADALTDPLGLSLAAVDEVENMAENQGVSAQLFGLLQEKFVNAFAAYAYLLFVLLYFPCVTVIATIAKESGKQWALFSATYSTGIAYLIASCFYQIVSFNKQPVFALIWLLSCAVILWLFYQALKRHASKTQNLTIPLNIQ